MTARAKRPQRSEGRARQEGVAVLLRPRALAAKALAEAAECRRLSVRLRESLFGREASSALRSMAGDELARARSWRGHRLARRLP
jgi:hypothetical protein